MRSTLRDAARRRAVERATDMSLLTLGYEVLRRKARDLQYVDVTSGCGALQADRVEPDRRS